MSPRKVRVGAQKAKEHVVSLDACTDPVALTWRLTPIQFTEEARPYTDRLRASKLHAVCVREHLLGYRLSLEKPVSLDLSSRVTFDLGNAIHSYLQNSPAYFGTRKYGWWKCARCGKSVFGVASRYAGVPCKDCRVPLQYDEHELFVDHPWRASGHIDLFVDVSDDDTPLLRVLDIKTIRRSEFQRLSSALADHRIQVIAYMMFLEHTDHGIPFELDLRSGYVLYVSKEHIGGGLPLKVFRVERDDGPLEYYVEDVLSTFQRGLDDPSFLPPAKAACVESDFTSWEAKQCPARFACRMSLGR